MGARSAPTFTESDAAIIKAKVNKLIGRYGFTWSDAPDLRQDLALHVLVQIRRLNPARGRRSAFVNAIVANEIADVIQRRRAKKRDNRRDVVLDDKRADKQIDEQSSPERHELQIDVRQVLKRMPADLRQVAELRMKHNEREIEGILGMTRARVRNRLQRIERFLREADLAPENFED